MALLGGTMTITTNAVGFVLDEDQQALIDKKMERIKYADDLIVDLVLRIKYDKKMIFDVTVNFRWGTVAHISSDDYDFTAGLNKMMDVLDSKIKKEKDKIQQKG
jgi:putative sigma-54 modulation protein